MKKRNGKKPVSLLLAAALVLGMSGTAALAEEEDYDSSVISGIQEDVISDDIAAEPAGDEIQEGKEDVTDSGSLQSFMEETEEESAESDAYNAENAGLEEVVETSGDIDGEEHLDPDIDDEIAEIESTGAKYTTVQEAADAAGFGDTVIMLADSAENVTIAEAQNIILDLDGFALDGGDTGSVITVYGSLTLTDSGTQGGTTSDNTGMVTGGKADYGGGVYVSEGGAFIMKGGAVTENMAKIDGGGVYVSDSSDSDTENTFEISGGAVTGNTAADQGGGVYIGNGNVMTMYDGAAIYGNSADVAAADICAKGDDDVKLIDAEEMELLSTDSDKVYDGWYPDTEGERYADAETAEKVDVSGHMESADGLIAGCDIPQDYGISMLASTSSSNATMAYPSVSGQLQVIGTQLCDKNGNPVQLKGISSHGLSWYPEYVNSACLSDLRSWGANVFRLAMYTADYNGYCTGSSSNQTTLKNLIKTGVNAARDNDMYVIIDWHILSDSNPLTYQSQAKTFFDEMSKEFAGYNNVIYEICNEPNSGTSWSDIRSYANTIIPVIRANDKNAVIIVGTPTWSQDVDVAAANPITGYSNIMYSLHFYAATHKDDLRNKMVSAINAGLPVFVSEYGICDSSGSGSIDESSANTWVSLMNEYGVSYVMWNMSNKDESSSILKSSVTKTSGFTYDDLSQAGRWVYNMLQNNSTSGSSSAELKKVNGVWGYYKNGTLQTSYTGFAENSSGKWYVEKGIVTKKTNGVFKDKTGAIGSSSEWYYVLNSKVQTGFTGLANYKNSSGWWYITKGKVDRSVNTIAKNKNGWWYVKNGKVDKSYTGFGTNSSGKWYVSNGKVTKTKNGVLKDSKGAIGAKNNWYYVLNSKVQTSFTGLANYSNASGWWYITKGKVDRSYNGLAKNKNGWFYLTNGKVNRSFTGLATNSSGTWYVKAGKVQKSYTGTVTIKGKKYSVKNGKV